MLIDCIGFFFAPFFPKTTKLCVALTPTFSSFYLFPLSIFSCTLTNSYFFFYLFFLFFFLFISLLFSSLTPLFLYLFLYPPFSFSFLSYAFLDCGPLEKLQASFFFFFFFSYFLSFLDIYLHLGVYWATIQFVGRIFLLSNDYDHHD